MNIIFMMKMILKYRTVILLIALGLIMLIPLPAGSQKIQKDELTMTVPFKVRETKDNAGGGSVYRNMVYEFNQRRIITQIVIDPLSWTEVDWNGMKETFSQTNDTYYVYGNMLNSYGNYELFYRFTDAGPATYVMYIHVLSSGHYYYICTSNLSHQQLIELIDSINVTAPAGE